MQNSTVEYQQQQKIIQYLTLISTSEGHNFFYSLHLLLQITHSGPNMWIVNHFPWWSFGLEQCVCVDIKEGLII